MKNYEYDYAMISEMVLIMENHFAFYDAVDTVKALYGNKALTYEMIAHAANYAMKAFQYAWDEWENTDFFLQPEYYKAAFEVIPDLWQTM